MSAALRLFAERRSQKGKGVRQLSQLRYAYYVERLLTSSSQLRPRRLRLKSLTMRGAPSFEQYYSASSGTYVLGCQPLVEVYRYFPPTPTVADASELVDGRGGESSKGDKEKLGHTLRLVYSDTLSGTKPRRQFTLLDDCITLPLDAE
eukprot:TRINITY_DN7046_c0_g2_i1.p1 TRINITY_DN7046_c0_g2~~TRINITY_DN7046_c0_g2_i1.p1  ORF type:complete len:148 (+),score=90.87 TRINITY_DN7046_c0_g2_i1:203-646(+)